MQKKLILFCALVFVRGKVQKKYNSLHVRSFVIKRAEKVEFLSALSSSSVIKSAEKVKSRMYRSFVISVQIGNLLAHILRR